MNGLGVLWVLKIKFIISTAGRPDSRYADAHQYVARVNAHDHKAVEVFPLDRVRKLGDMPRIFLTWFYRYGLWNCASGMPCLPSTLYQLFC